MIGDVLRERQRQEDLHAPRTCANPDMPDGDKLAVLTEEVGEVAKALCERDEYDTGLFAKALRDELIHVAAVAVAWAEALS